MSSTWPTPTRPRSTRPRASPTGSRTTSRAAASAPARRSRYFRDWVTYTGIATPAYATLVGVPGRDGQRYYLSGTRSWRPRRGGARRGAVVRHAAGRRAEQHQPARRARRLRPASPAPPQTDPPGTFAAWTGPALTARSTSPARRWSPCGCRRRRRSSTQAGGPAGQLVLFVKVLDVAPDGTASLIHGLRRRSGCRTSARRSR